MCSQNVEKRKRVFRIYKISVKVTHLISRLLFLLYLINLKIILKKYDVPSKKKQRIGFYRVDNGLLLKKVYRKRTVLGIILKQIF